MFSRSVRHCTHQSVEKNTLNITDIHASLRLYCTSQTWLEGNAVEQLKRITSLPDVEYTVGMPDLHPGKGWPVGAAFITAGQRFYPLAIGNDIGCGMGLWQTDVIARKCKPERLARKLSEITGRLWQGDLDQWLNEHRLAEEVAGLENGLGTIGHGNHFAELLEPVKIVDQDYWQQTGLLPHNLFLLVHCGSRGHGEKLLRECGMNVAGLTTDSPEGQTYITRHNRLLQWAKINRRLVAAGMLQASGMDATPVLDNCHNSITPIPTATGNSGWLHRKGAAAADSGILIIAGSRGSHSYLVRPTGNPAEYAWSLAHGAGRKWDRQGALGRLKERFRADDLRRTELRSLVVCNDKDLLFEEAPQAYKKIEQIIADLESFGLIKVIGLLKPVLTFKQ